MDNVKKETASPPQPVGDYKTGFAWLEVSGGWRAFLKAYLKMDISDEAASKLGFVRKETNGDSFQTGVNAMTALANNMSKIADDFCREWIQALYEKGYRIRWGYQSKQALKDGTIVGPGVAIILKKADDKDVTNPLVLQNEALAIGKSLESSREGIRITVDQFEYGLASGVRIFEAVVENPKGTSERLLIESLGFGLKYGTISASEFEVMNARVQSIWKNIVEPSLITDHEKFRHECEQLMKELSRRVKNSLISDDVQVWENIRDEIGIGCPAFARLPEAAQAQIFHRIKVRLGLVDDDI